MFAMWLLALLAAPPQQATVADVVLMRGGPPLYGQVLDAPPRGKILVVARRSWVKEHLPERYPVWNKAEEAVVKRAVAQRRERLEQWKRERGAEQGDAIGAWLDKQLAADRTPAKTDDFRLMLVAIDRSAVRDIRRTLGDGPRMLRQAWRANFPDPETTPKADLARKLEGRGFAMSDVDAAPIDDLVPPFVETDERWAVRRAATEIKAEPALRFIRHGPLLLPEDTDGKLPEGALAGAAGDVLKGLLGDQGAARPDPLDAKLRDIASRGRSGALVTTLTISEDVSTVEVASILYARINGAWQPAIRRPFRVRMSDVRNDEADPVANDPRVKEIFGVLDSLGIGADAKRLGLTGGAATRRALGQAQSAMNAVLDSAAIPLDQNR